MVFGFILAENVESEGRFLEVPSGSELVLQFLGIGNNFPGDSFVGKHFSAVTFTDVYPE
jgi:hypothetical protein